MSIPVPVEQLKARLVEEGLIGEQQFDALAEEGGRKNQGLVDLLISEKAIDPNYLYGLIASILGVPRISFSVYPINEQLVRLLPENVARQKQVVVFTKEKDGSYGVAMVDPSDLETIKFLSEYLGNRITPYLATESDLNRGFSVYGMQTAGDFKKIIEENVQVSLRSHTKSAEEAAADLPIVAIVDNLLSYAASSRASDVHIEALEDATLIRYRIDGILFEVMRISKTVHPAIVARIKLLAGLKIDEHYKPQDGRFRYQMASQTVDVRVSVLPTYYAEKIVLRLLASSQKPLSLEELGFLPEDAKVVANNLKKAYGMILVCGPTGSGKSTTLYGIINILNRPNVNIITVEDPVEYNMRYVNQAQINVQAGITFASGLRAILRQDPNIIMVGEIRDGETANISVQAALTGHLLLSTIHTNDAVTAIPRLFDLNVPPFLVSSVLCIIIAQRLVRRICPVCIYSFGVDDSIKATILAQFRYLNIKEDLARVPSILFKGKGCEGCGHTGYRGRLGIFEVLEVAEQVKRAIASPKFDLGQLKEAAQGQGMRSMFVDGLRKAQLGQTTIEEVLRVIRE